MSSRNYITTNFSLKLNYFSYKFSLIIFEHVGQDKNFAVVFTGNITSVAHDGHFVLYFSGVTKLQRGHYTDPAYIGARSLTPQLIHYTRYVPSFYYGVFS